MVNSKKIDQEIHELHQKFNIGENKEFNDDDELDDFIKGIGNIISHKKIEILKNDRKEKLNKIKNEKNS